jgi:hypothetical protein
MIIYCVKAGVNRRKRRKREESYYGGGTKFTVPRLCPLVLSCKCRLRRKTEVWEVKKIRWSRTGVVVGTFLEFRRPCEI